MSGKLLSLFAHPEFVRRAQERAERELAQRVLPSERIAPSRMRCRRCALEFEVLPRIPTTGQHEVAQPCPQCEPAADRDALEAFLQRLTLTTDRE